MARKKGAWDLRCTEAATSALLLHPRFARRRDLLSWATGMVVEGNWTFAAYLPPRRARKALGAVADQIVRNRIIHLRQDGVDVAPNVRRERLRSRVSQADLHTVHDNGFWTNSYVGVTRSGESGSYTYSAKPGRENKPVNFVSFYVGSPASISSR